MPTLTKMSVIKLFLAIQYWSLLSMIDQTFAFPARRRNTIVMDPYRDLRYHRQQIDNTYSVLPASRRNGIRAIYANHLESFKDGTRRSSLFPTQQHHHCVSRRDFHNFCFGSFVSIVTLGGRERAMASLPPLKKTLSSSSCSALEDARSQLDLAVQASSVQAFQDAAELSNDVLLDQDTLEQAFESCGSGSGIQSGVDESSSSLDRTTSLQAIIEFRQQLNKPSKLSTEEAMASMKYGTSARAAMDGFLNKNSK